MHRPAGLSDSESDRDDWDGFEVTIPTRSTFRESEQESNKVASSNNKQSSWLPLNQPASDGAQIDLKSAVEAGDLSVVKSCLAAGLEINCHLDTAGGPTPAMLAASLVQTKILSIFLSNGGICQYQDSGQVSTGIHAVASAGDKSEDMVICGELLLEVGEQVNSIGRQGLSPLMLAARSGAGGFVRWLLEKGAVVDKRDWQGWTALMFSVDSGHGDVTRLLIELGADLNIVSKDGQKAVDIAAANGSTVLVEVLEELTLDKKVLGGQKGGQANMMGSVGKLTEMENVLLGLGLKEYIGTFRTQEVGLEEFLLLREDDIVNMGVDKVGAVKRLIQGQAEIHKKDWEKSSLPVLGQDVRRQGLMVSCPDVTCMVSNIGQHAKYMKANLGYIRLQLRDHGTRLLEVGGHMVSPRVFLQQTNSCYNQMELLLGEVRSLKSELAQFPVTKLVGPQDSVVDTRSFLDTRRFLFVTSVFATFGLVWARHRLLL